MLKNCNIHVENNVKKTALIFGEGFPYRDASAFKKCQQNLYSQRRDRQHSEGDWKTIPPGGSYNS